MPKIHHRIPKDQTTDLVVVSSCAAMPNSCWGIYRRAALVEIPRSLHHIAAIDSRRLTIVTSREKLNVGSTTRCAFARALTELIVICDEMAVSDATQSDNVD